MSVFSFLNGVVNCFVVNEIYRVRGGVLLRKFVSKLIRIRIGFKLWFLNFDVY